MSVAGTKNFDQPPHDSNRTHLVFSTSGLLLGSRAPLVLLVVVSGPCARWQSIQGEGSWNLSSFWIWDAKSWIRLRWSKCRTSRSHRCVKMLENVRKQWQTANRRTALWSWQRETVPKLWLLLVWQWLDATSTGSSPQFLRSDVNKRKRI